MSAPVFDALLAVQRLDTELAQLRHRRETLAERALMASLDADRQRIEIQTADATAARDRVAAAQAELEGELDAAERRAASVSTRMYSGEVSASRELQAMAADVEAQTARASDLEDRILALLEEREPLDATVVALAEELEALARRRADAADALAQGEAALDTDIARVRAEREEAAAAVPAELLATYDRLRGRLGGVGAARLVGDRCDGCHLTLPATELDRIRHEPPDAVVTCDQCGRILIRP